MKKYLGFLFFIVTLSAQFTSCKENKDGDDNVNPTGNPTATPVTFTKPKGFPDPLIPSDNPLTEEGILLGRMLFYDPILSGDSTISCSSCHKQENAFATNNEFDNGIHHTHGGRNAMALTNLAWVNNGFFWDGRSASLEKQAVEPVHNPVEMDLSWPEAVKRLQNHPDYPERFKKAFGTNQVSQDYATKAIAQFVRTIVSNDSKFDKAMRMVPAKVQLTESEMRGLALFDADPKGDGLGGFIGGGSCNHCHGSPNLFLLQPLDEAGAYKNNGLDSANTINDFKDKGYALVKPSDKNYGKFKVPSLRNVALTAPYMHDGRFKTLEEVIDHYNNGGHPSPTLDVEMAANRFADLGGKLHLSEQDKKDLVAFLKTLSDESITTNPAFSNPFK